MSKEQKHLDWVDGLKAFAIIMILLNHFVESFKSFPWFSCPSYNWPDISVRLSNIFPADGSIIWRLVQFLGWLGDMGPGIFILVSGFTLTLSALNRNGSEFSIKDFYSKRLLRIFPLYIVIHFLVIIIIALLRSIDFTAPELLFSMLGLRFTDNLFFYINPSWWFIWLILQLYFIFPLLFKILSAKGIRFFLIITFGITIMSRSVGLINLTWSKQLEYWMIGIFAGTRLSEFAAGMILAKLITEKRVNLHENSVAMLFLFGLAFYISGFICSLFYFTTLFSNTLITIGLTGILISAFRLIESNTPWLINPLKWIGVVSFPVFLLHQPLMTLSGSYFTGFNKALVQLSVLLLVFPAGWFIEKTVNQVIALVPKIKDRLMTALISLSLILQLLLNVTYFVTQNYLIYKADNVIFVFNIFFIPMTFALGFRTKCRFLKDLLIIIIPASVIFLFLLTRNWFNIFWIFSLFLTFAAYIVSFFKVNSYLRIFITTLAVLTVILVAEKWLMNNKPVEVNRWGELPTLQKDTKTVYSLIPNKTTHLKYNNYDYYVKTNSLGFNGPEVDLGEKDSNEIRIMIIGDAFTMPEGMEYEKAYPELLQANLSERYPEKEIRTFNAGVTGFGPNEMFAQLKKFIDTINPDIFLNEVFINEFQEINLDSTARLASLKFSKLAFREELFSGCQLPDQISYKIHKLLKDKQYLNYTYYKSLVFFYEKQSDLFSNGNISKLDDYFLNVKSLCESKNCDVIVLFAPGQLEISKPDDIDYYPYHISLGDTTRYDLNLPGNILKKLAYNADIKYLNPSIALKSNNMQPVYFRESWHWNPEGHKVIADFLGKEIAKIIDNN
jgi:peptidoglycan/LPS O-acetylase OafA/YrhL